MAVPEPFELWVLQLVAVAVILRVPQSLAAVASRFDVAPVPTEQPAAAVAGAGVRAIDVAAVVVAKAIDVADLARSRALTAVVEI